MATQSTLRFGAQTDEVTSLLRIVNMVRTGEAVTRPEIGRVTGLGRGVVTQRVDLAIATGFLEDAELGPSSGGRAPRRLRFRSERGRVIVCALGALHVHVGLLGLDGDVQAQGHALCDISRGPQTVLAQVVATVDELLADTPGAPVWGVAVGLPGPVDFASGRPVSPPIMPGWNGFDVRTLFEGRYGAPVWVDNDVNLLAYAERSRRPGDQLDLVYCKVGTGIGAGLVSQGRVHRGANGAAGDIGHVRVLNAHVLCRCGKTGCLEAVAGGWAMVRDAETALAGGVQGPLAQRRASGAPLRPEDVAAAANRGDPLAIGLMQRSAQTVGEAVAGLVNMFNPSAIVIGGAVASAGELYLAEVRRRIYELSLPLATRDLVVDSSVNDITDPLRGGLEMVREQLFDVTFPRWFADGAPSVTAIRGLVPA